MTAPTSLVGLDPAAGYGEILSYYLGQWGLSSLVPLVTQLGQSGAGNDQIQLTIQNSPEYQARFSGNAARVASGLGALDPASYVALEGQYRQILSQLPSGFYDTQDHMAGLIGGDVSPSELSDRVSMANQAYITAPQSNRDAWNAYYGGGAGGAVAAILDTTTAEPLLQQQVTAAGIGGSAVSQGLALTKQSTATAAAQQGVTIDQARAAYSQIATRLSTDQSTSGRFASAGTTPINQDTEEQATLLGNGAALKQQQLVYSEEQAQFAGHGGAGGDGSAGNAGSNY